ncbi:polysaccharide biosynthesis protein [Haloechinothrix salitolerans]|uniref:Lipopolysaccharide biosynthesis protein n=1 Tax=Haloechinothrix salitolerans TaxID=926830 RepID=A0ABW2BRL5_9PSEU
MTRVAAGLRGTAKRAQVDTLIVAIAFGTSNIGAYLLNVIAPRLLSQAQWGEFGSLLAILVVGAVPALGLQTFAALRVAKLRTGETTSTHLRDLPQRDLGQLFTMALTASAAVTGLLIAATPLLMMLLHFSTPWPTLCVAVALTGVTCNGIFLGMLQGAQRFGALARLIIIDGLGRTGAALVGLLVFGTPTGALGTMVVGTLLVATTGWLMCGRPPLVKRQPGHVSEVFHAGQALLGLVLLVNLDLILARHHLPPDAGGEYAVGWVMTRMAYWLPYAMAVVALPRLADAEQRRRVVPITLGFCAGLNALVVLVAVVFGSDIVTLIGGGGYAASTLPLWAFALVGSLLSLVQILLYSRIASADRRSTVLVWVAVGIEIALVTVWLHDSLLEIVTAAVATTAGLVLTSALIELRHSLLSRHGNFAIPQTPRL